MPATKEIPLVTGTDDVNRVRGSRITPDKAACGGTGDRRTPDRQPGISEVSS